MWDVEGHISSVFTVCVSLENSHGFIIITVEKNNFNWKDQKLVAEMWDIKCLRKRAVSGIW